MIFQSFKMAMKAIAGNKMRSFLTILGVVIGVLAIVVLVAIAQGANAQVTSQHRGPGHQPPDLRHHQRPAHQPRHRRRAGTSWPKAKPSPTSRHPDQRSRNGQGRRL